MQEDPVKVLTNQTALNEFSTSLQNQMADFFGVPPSQVSSHDASACTHAMLCTL